jgi:hypothetical protein
MSWTDLTEDDKISYISSIHTGDDVCMSIINKDDLSGCIFRAQRSNKKCESKAVNNHGYCSLHSKTLQAKNAEVKLRELHEKIAAEAAAETEGKNYEEVNSKNVKDKKKTKDVPEKEKPTPPPSQAKELPKKSIKDAKSSSSNAKETSLNTKEKEAPVKEKESKEKLDVEKESSHDSDHDREPEPSKKEKSVKFEEKHVKKVVKASRNKWGRFEHLESGIVFDPLSRKAYGIQHKNGAVYSLSPKEVSICIKNGWSYTLPQTKYTNGDSDEDEDSENSTSSDE